MLRKSSLENNYLKRSGKRRSIKNKSLENDYKEFNSMTLENKEPEEICLGRKLSDTLIKLKEKITPRFERAISSSESKSTDEFTPPQEPEEKEDEKPTSNPYETWLKKKNEQIRKIQMYGKLKAQKRVRDSGGKKAHRFDNSSSLDARGTRYTQLSSGLHYSSSSKLLRPKSITSVNEWEDIKSQVDISQKREPLKLRQYHGQGPESAPNLTKYIIKPDAAFQARYRNIINQPKPSEVTVDTEQTEETEDPALLPLNIRRLLQASGTKWKANKC